MYSFPMDLIGVKFSEIKFITHLQYAVIQNMIGVKFSEIKFITHLQYAVIQNMTTEPSILPPPTKWSYYSVMYTTNNTFSKPSINKPCISSTEDDLD